MSARCLRAISAVSLVCTLVLSVGCNPATKPEAEPEPEHAEVGRSPMEHPEPEEVEIEPSPEELPVPEDFEAEAEQQITAETLRAQLDALEIEISADAP